MNRTSVLRALCMVMCAALVLFGAGGLSPVAYADGTLQINDLTISPSSLPEGGGTVTLSGTLENTTGEDIDTVTLTVGSYQLEINDTIAAGGTRAFTMVDVPIAASEVGIELMLAIDWPTGTNTKAFTVPEEEKTVDLAFTRTVDNQSVQSGDSVKLTYNLKNNGTATITNLKLTDSCVDGTILSGLTLEPGDTKQVTSTITVTSETTSVPKAEYTANSVARTKSLESMTITIKNADLSVTATADKTDISAGETVTFTITIQNDSPVAVSNIKVTDDLGNIVRSSTSIKATTGTTPKTADITYEIQMTTGRAVSFTITYPSGTGSATKTSDPILVNVTGLLPGVSPLDLQVSASPVAMASFPGEVTFTVTIQNTSGQAISSINVSEASLGNVGSIVTLAPGESQSLPPKTATLQAAGSFTFTATGADPTGTDIEPATAQVVVTSSVGTPTPQTVEPEDTDTLSTLFIIMIVIVALIVLAGVTLIILMIQERRSKGNGPKGGGGRARRRRKPKEDSDDGDSLFALRDSAEPLHNRRDDSGVRRRPSDMEQTQPILRSGLTSTSTGRPLHSPGRRRTYKLQEDDPIAPRRDEGVLEERDSAMFGPASFTKEEENASHLHREPLNGRHGGGQRDQTDADSNQDREAQLRRRRPTLQDEERPQKRPRYENEDDDDLPPLRPRRRR